jgi:hypothetical protein
MRAVSEYQKGRPVSIIKTIAIATVITLCVFVGLALLT